MRPNSDPGLKHDSRVVVLAFPGGFVFFWCQASRKEERKEDRKKQLGREAGSIKERRKNPLPNPFNPNPTPTH